MKDLDCEMRSENRWDPDVRPFEKGSQTLKGFGRILKIPHLKDDRCSVKGYFSL